MNGNANSSEDKFCGLLPLAVARSKQKPISGMTPLESLALAPSSEHFQKFAYLISHSHTFGMTNHNNRTTETVFQVIVGSNTDGHTGVRPGVYKQ